MTLGNTISAIHVEIVGDAPRPARAAQSAAFDAAWLTLAAVVLVASLLLELRGQTQVSLFGWTLPELCLWRRTLGVNCLGCGMTRAVMHFIHLDFDSALFYNQGSLVVAPALVVLWFFWLLNAARELHFLKKNNP